MYNLYTYVKNNGNTRKVGKVILGGEGRGELRGRFGGLEMKQKFREGTEGGEGEGEDG